MSNNITVNIELFGFLQDHSKQKTIPVKVPNGSTISEIKKQLAVWFENPTNDQKLKDLPDNCVLSNDKEILFDDVRIVGNANLAVLPPVCGG